MNPIWTGGGYYFAVPLTGSYTLFAVASGYQNASVPLTISSQGRVTTITQNIGVIPVTGSSCGSSNGGSFTSEPIDNLCAVGTSTSVTPGLSGWTWSCTGAGGDVACWASKQNWTLFITATGTGNGTITSSPIGITYVVVVEVFHLIVYKGAVGVSIPIPI